MRSPAALFSMVLSATILAPAADAREPIKIKACTTISQPGSYELVVVTREKVVRSCS
jgi:hypothetical protein